MARKGPLRGSYHGDAGLARIVDLGPMNKPALLLLLGAAGALGVVGWSLFRSDAEDPAAERARTAAIGAAGSAEPTTRAAAPDLSSGPVSEIANDLAPAPAAAEVAAPESDVPPAELLIAEVRVRVEDEHHQPLAGATVKLTSGVPGRFSIPVPFGDFEVEIVSPEDGWCAFKVPPTGVFTVVGERAGFAARTLGPLMPNDEVTLELARGAALAGRLVDDESGLPVADALLRIDQDSIERTTSSRADGLFEFIDLPADTYEVEVLAAGYEVVEIDGLQAFPGANEIAEHRLQPAEPLGGVVLDAVTAAPLGGVRVAIAAERRSNGERGAYLRQETTTDGTGRFRFDHVSRRGLELTADAEGYAMERDRIRIEADTEQLEIAMRRASSIAGVVRDANGEPVAGARLRLGGGSRWDSDERRIESGRDGSFAFERVRPGNAYEVIAAHAEQGFGPTTVAGVVVEEGREPQPVEIVLQQGAEIRGTVTDGLGQPAPYALVTIEGVPDRAWQVMQQGGGPLRYADAAGKFSVRGLPEAKLKIGARRVGDLAPAVEVAVVAGGVHDIELKLDQGAFLMGIVTDTQGQPIDDVVVMAFAGDFLNAMRGGPGGGRDGRGDPPGGGGGRGGRAEFGAGGSNVDANRMREMMGGGGRDRRLSSFRGMVRTGADGRFAMSGLVAGEPMLVTFRKDGYGQAFESGVLADGTERRVTLSPLLAISGRVVDARTRKPVAMFRASAEVVRTDDGSAARTTPPAAGGMGRNGPLGFAGGGGRSDVFQSQDGTFALKGLAPGAYDVGVRADGYKRGEPQRVVLGPGGAPQLQFEVVPSSIVRGRVHARDDSPVANVSIFLREQREPSAFADKTQGKRKTSRAQADRNGRYTFSDLDPGTYELTVGPLEAPMAGPAVVRLEEGGLVEQDFRMENVGDVEVLVRGQSAFALPNAPVTLRGPNRLTYRTRTDGFGRARFKNVPVGDYTLTASAGGYETKTDSVSVRRDDETSETLHLNKVGG